MNDRVELHERAWNHLFVPREDSQRLPPILAKLGLVMTDRRSRLAWLFPGLTALVVLVTGLHYILDILGGLAVVVIAVRLTEWSTRRRRLAHERLRT